MAGFQTFSRGRISPFGDTRINVRDGSFSTNFVELLYNEVYEDAGHGGEQLTFMRTGLRVHIPVNEDPELHDRSGTFQYGRYRLVGSMTGRLGLPFLESKRVHKDVSGRLTLGYQYLLDKKVVNSSFLNKHRFIGSATYAIIPSPFKDFGMFFQYYYGQDYYNILYASRLNMFRLGITALSVSDIRERH